MTPRVQIEGKAGPVNGLDDNIEKLKTAAEAGKVDDLYDVIQHEPRILERMDEAPFAHTPLHIAASKGQMDFAMEMMNLKSSFSRKLNPCGFTPLHLAVQNNHFLMVMWLLDVDTTLARVKGRGGKTPLHLAAEQRNAEQWNADTLTEFFEACPESIKDVTIQGDTALHLALKEENEAAFNLLFGWLNRSVFPYAEFWEAEIINWKNKEGNTILDIAAEKSLHQVVKLLIASGARTDVENLPGRTAMAIRSIDTRAESRVGRLFCRRIPNSRAKTLVPTILVSDYASFQRRSLDLPSLVVVRLQRFSSTFISSEFRSAMQVVDGLIGTITYQAAMNPPGGVWQGSAGISSPEGNIIRHDKASNSTATATEATDSHHVGTTVMSTPIFSLFWVTNTVFFLSAVRRLTTSVPHTSLFTFEILIWFVACYFLSMSVTSPSTAWSNFNLILLFFLGLVYLLWLLSLFRRRMSWLVREPKQERRRSRKDPDSRVEWWQ